MLQRDRVLGAIDGDARKHMIPSIREGLEAFLLGSAREAINRSLHKINELERGITRDVRAKKIVKQPEDLPTPETPANRMHALGFGLNLILQSNRLYAVSDCIRFQAFRTCIHRQDLHSECHRGSQPMQVHS